MIISGNSAFFVEDNFRAERGQGAKHLKETKPECVLIQPNSGGFRSIQVDSTKSKIKKCAGRTRPEGFRATGVIKCG
jgi:hypothetical protein